MGPEATDELSDLATSGGRLEGSMRALDRARSLLRSNFGRNDGWYVELDGAVVGELEDPVWVDMFWHSYSLRCVAAEHRLALQEDELWNRCAFVFRNRRTKEIPPWAFAGGSPKVRDGRVTMRGLYLAPTSVLERACLRALQRFGRRDHTPP